MSSEESRKISDQDLQMVQNLIEQCLQRYMTLKEVANILSVQEKIEPCFTELVWQKLEQENQEFFKAYHLRLMLKEQILEFNRLLGRQVEMMNSVDTAGVSFLPANGSHMPTLHQSPAFYTPHDMGHVLKRENMQQPITPNIPNDFSNYGVLTPPCLQTAINMPSHSRGTDITPNILAHSSNVGISQVMNGGIIKAEAGYCNIPHFFYHADGNVMETRSANGDPSISPFGSVELNSQHLNETLVDPDNSSFGILAPLLPQHFNLSSLEVEFPHEALSQNYSKPPFIGRDSGNFLDSHGRGDNQEDARRLNTISDNLNFEDFCKD